MNKVSIIGFGRFGTMLHQLLIKGFEVDVFDIDPINQSDINFDMSNNNENLISRIN